MMRFHFGDRDDEVGAEGGVREKNSFIGELGDGRDVVAIEVREARVEAGDFRAITGKAGDVPCVAAVAGAFGDVDGRGAEGWKTSRAAARTATSVLIEVDLSNSTRFGFRGRICLAR